MIIGQKNLKSVIKIQAIVKGFLVRKKRATEKGLEDPKPQLSHRREYQAGRINFGQANKSRQEGN